MSFLCNFELPLIRVYLFQILSKIEPFVYEWTSKQRGSISAEHGLGLMKANKIYYSKSAETVSLSSFCDVCFSMMKVHHHGSFSSLNVLRALGD